MENTSQLMTPYEQYLRQNLDEEKRKADRLALAYASARGLKKFTLKRDLDRLNQNIQILSNDLQKYLNGLKWLREPTKERDEKAEHLKPVPAEALAGQASPKAQAPPQQRPAAPQAAPGRPQIGTPIGAQSRPVISHPGPASTAITAPQVAAPQPAPEQRPSPTPVANAPGGRPRIGTPIGTPIRQAPSSPAPQQAPQAEAPISQATTEQQPAPQVAKRPMIGTPIGSRPRIGTPIAKKPDETTDSTDSGQGHENSESSSS